MCITTGPSITIYIVEVTTFLRLGGTEKYIQGYFSKREWAEEYVTHWRNIHPKRTYAIKAHELDWWMRCH